jgi:hypothetical protein
MIAGIGTTKFIVINADGRSRILELTNVHYAPDARHNLLSISTLTRTGLYAILNGKALKVFKLDTRDEIAYTPLHPNSNVYILPTKRSPALPITMALAVVDFNDPVWSEHQRLRHLALDGMRRLLKMSNSIDLTDKQIKAKLKDVYLVCYTTRALYKIPRDLAK